MRRTKATLIYKQTKNLRAVQLLFGYTNGCHPKPLTKTANRGAYASTSATCVTPVILLSQLHRQQWPSLSHTMRPACMTAVDGLGQQHIVVQCVCFAFNNRHS
jgi:hypothetical protein